MTLSRRLRKPKSDSDEKKHSNRRDDERELPKQIEAWTSEDGEHEISRIAIVLKYMLEE